MPRLYSLFQSVLLASLLTACASEPPPPPPPTVLKLHFLGSSELNPSPAGDPAPVRVRLYELKSPNNFSRADFFTLIDKPESALGSDLVAHDELLLRPSEQKELERTLDEATKYLAIVVAYRDLDHATWRQVLSVPVQKTSPYDVMVGSHAVAITPRSAD
ncbi:MAG: type VI secretion system lipoprotein TssJ [Pseudomonas sp.]|uniref:type VI secretion system lipoprotein TssJ n=1 Tax=Pseudomonas sp. TaxID=306 RepID=UPI000D84DABB